MSDKNWGPCNEGVNPPKSVQSSIVQKGANPPKTAQPKPPTPKK